MTNELTNEQVNELRTRAAARRGFTLIEIMVVLFILMVIAGVAVGAFRGIREGAKRDGARLYITNLATSLEHYEMAMGSFPTTQQGLIALLQCPSDASNTAKWDGPYIKENSSDLDPWGNPYQYQSPGQHSSVGFDLWSFGPDGMNGTDDDIGNWQ